MKKKLFAKIAVVLTALCALFLAACSPKEESYIRIFNGYGNDVKRIVITNVEEKIFMCDSLATIRMDDSKTYEVKPATYVVKAIDNTGHECKTDEFTVKAGQLRGYGELFVSDDY